MKIKNQEKFVKFDESYGERRERIMKEIEGLGNERIRKWEDDIGEENFIGQ